MKKKTIERVVLAFVVYSIASLIAMMSQWAFGIPRNAFAIAYIIVGFGALCYYAFIESRIKKN